MVTDETETETESDEIAEQVAAIEEMALASPVAAAFLLLAVGVVIRAFLRGRSPRKTAA